MPMKKEEGVIKKTTSDTAQSVQMQKSVYYHLYYIPTGLLNLLA